MAEKPKNSEKNSHASPPAAGILSSIVSKERELELFILQAHEKANQVIQEARVKATGIVNARKAEAETEAEKVKKELVARAKKEAEKIRKDAVRKVKKLKDTPSKKLDRAVKHLLKMVLP